MDFIEILEKTYSLVEFVETKFSQQLTKRKTDKKYEIDFNFFSMNPKKKYIGAFFERKNKKLTFWAGYDIAVNHFCISFCSTQNEILKQVLEASLFSYSAEYIVIDEYYWYSIYIDVPYKTNDDKDKELKNSTNEIDYSSLENDIITILSNFDTEVKKARNRKCLMTKILTVIARKKQ